MRRLCVCRVWHVSCQVKDRALEATSRMLGPRQQPGQLANAGLLLGLGRAAVDQAMGAEAAAGFRDQAWRGGSSWLTGRFALALFLVLPLHASLHLLLLVS